LSIESSSINVGSDLSKNLDNVARLKMFQNLLWIQHRSSKTTWLTTNDFDNYHLWLLIQTLNREFCSG
jgi:hypothetical protein